MKFGIRVRFALWLLAVVLPVVLAGIFVFGRIEDQVSERAGADLESVRDLEAARVNSVLRDYRDQAESLAAGPHVRDFTAAIVDARAAGSQSAVIGGYDGFAEIDAFDVQPLDELAEALRRKAGIAASELGDLQLISHDGLVLGATGGFDWDPYDSHVIGSVIDSATTMFGNAYRDRDGADRLGIVTPISVDGRVVGALLIESDLGPIVDLVVAHEGFGETSEAHIAQVNRDGDAEFITPLRFERDAALTKIVPAERRQPINQALEAPDGLLVWAPDYRGADSILAVKTIEATGWGLVVKVDRDEAIAPLFDEVDALKLVVVMGILATILGWATLLDPIARRLNRLADGAERVASGEYDSPLADRSSDEIGTVAANIDRLATDLAVDIAVLSDIENQLRHQATRDETTGLFNRQYASGLMRDLSTPAAENRAEETFGKQFSLLFLDLDDFKVINDTYGHRIGDQVLCSAAERLVQVVPAPGVVARWGGDEFVVILPGANSVDAAKTTQLVLQGFEEPLATTAGMHQIRVSVGSSTLLPGESVDAVLHDADDAMFEQKQARSGRRTVSPETVRLVEGALDRDAIEVWYQPVVSGAGSALAIRGCEALVRIRRVDGSLAEPDSFLDEIQRSHLGRSVDHRVIRTALREVAGWIGQGWLPADFQVSVNCGEALMRDSETVQFIRDRLAEYSLTGENLMLEITESSSVVRPELVDELESLGVRVAIDDLGLNHSNMDRLIDGGALTAKIDRRWLPSAAPSEAANHEVLRHLVSLCQALGVHIIAEGIETVVQLDVMQNLGVDTFQGYLFSHPLTAEGFEAAYRPAASGPTETA